jgi:membrane protein implicated in regulation of membrane protease activity
LEVRRPSGTLGVTRTSELHPPAMENWHIWTIAGILLFIVEMLTFTFFAAAFGVAAFVTAYASTKDIGTTWELGTFAITSALCVLAVRPLFSKVIYKRSEHKPVLVAGLIGQGGTVVDEIESEGGHGRVKTGGEEWRAIACDPRGIPAGTRVEIVAVQGATLTVRPV